MRLRVSNHGGTFTVTDAETGQPVEGVKTVIYAADEFDPAGTVTLYVDAAFVDLDLTVDAVEIVSEG